MKSASLQFQKHRPTSSDCVWERVRERAREISLLDLGREFGMESTSSVDSMGESSGGSLGIRVLSSSSLRQLLFDFFFR